MPAISETGRPTRSSFQGPAKGLSLYAPFTHFFVNCCYSVAYLTPDEARDPGFTIIVTCLPSIPYDAGIVMARISTLNYLFWLPTSGIKISAELSVIFISPPKSFRRSQHA